MKTLLQRFMDKVNSDWQWTARKTEEGYGQMRFEGKALRAHRVSYELFNGPIPDGMFVLHSCDDPSCVNPDHLHLGNDSMNIREAYQRKRRIPLPSYGESNKHAKLTEDQVLEIRKLVAEGRTRASVVKQFGVSKSQVANIVTKKQWGHVK